MDVNSNFWRLCSSCKRKQIPYSGKYYECSVSTCTGKRTGYAFCSMQCFETHLPGARHRDAGAIEKFAPTYQQAVAEAAGDAVAAKAAASSVSTGSSSHASSSMSNANEVLVVVSKMKQYIKDRADMNTSADVADILSDQIRRACDRACEVARADGRKTVMARDFK
jgi:histone H3/H4